MKLFRALYRVLLPATLAIVLSSACTVGIYGNHPSLQGIEENTPVATVYFIRPELIKPKGYPDRPLRVDFNHRQILRIDQGRYTMLKIKAGEGEVTTHSLTKFTNQKYPINVSRKHYYNFQAGITYFIYLKQLNEEYRGVFYYPKPITLSEAKKVILDARPSRISGADHIDNLVSVREVPVDSHVQPALPEQLYPQAPYLLKKPVTR